MSAHTPGPWAYRPSNNGHFIAGTGENSGYLAEVRQCRSKQDIRADARLIAAAPDLLAALKKTAEHIEAMMAHIEHKPLRFKQHCWQQALNARAAIAKAEGRA